MKKEWIAPEVMDINVNETANSSQPDTPPDDLHYDYYHECTTCS